MKMRWTFRVKPNLRWRRFIAALAIGAQLLGIAPRPAQAALALSPVWWQASAAASSSWHYRVPVTLASAPAIGSTVVTNVDFAALLSTLGVPGTLDVNSPRVVDSTGALVPTQEFTDSIYVGATDATGNGRGEIRFLANSAATTYYIYFDVTANGIKGANTAAPIGGNFENTTAGTQQPPGWAVVRAPGAVDSQVRPSETPSITTDGTLVGNGGPVPRTVNGTPRTGSFSYLLGARSANEPTTGLNLVTLSKSIVVPATNPGALTFRYRVQGWDSNDNLVTGTYDYLRAIIIAGGTTTEVVGPLANNYTTYPFSPNLGTTLANANAPGYGQYNGFDTNTNGVHTAGMSVAQGAEPWWTVSVNLAPWAGQTITLRFSANHTVVYRSWWHIDDVEWSVVSATVGSPQAFGAALQLPAGSASSTYYPNQVLSIRGRLDAVGTTGSVLADLYRPDGTLAVSGIVLYNDATHGDAAAADSIWTNDGSVPANPTYTFTSASPSGVWTVVLRGNDATNTSVRIPGQPASPVNGMNYFNVDAQTLTLQPFNTLTGHVYLDANRNGLYDTGEAAFRTIQIKLIQAGVVIAQATPDINGIYTFGSLKAGTYTVVPSTNSTNTDTSPSLPAGYTQSQPKTATFTTDLAGGVTVNDDIGLYATDISVSGKVFLDNGAGGATPLDGIQGSSELPLQGLLVSATTSGGVLLAQVASGPDGAFTLGIPVQAAGSPVVLSVQPRAGDNLGRVFAGTTAGTLDQVAGTVTFTPTTNNSYSGVVFSELPVSTLTASQMKTAPAGTSVGYAHRVNVGVTGTLSLALVSSPPGNLPAWSGVLYRDAMCSGTLTGSETPLASSIAVLAGDSICLVVHDAVPASASMNMQNRHQLSATVAAAGGTYTQPVQVNVDITTVGAAQGAGLTLVKAVRNLTTNSGLAINSQALPGETLQYQLTFRNDTATPVSNVQLFDAVPTYGIFVSATCGTMPAGVTSFLRRQMITRLRRSVLSVIWEDTLAPQIRMSNAPSLT